MPPPRSIARASLRGYDFDPDGAAVPGSGIFGLPFAPRDSRVVVLPVPFEATTSYGEGTAGGPAAILDASRQIDLFDYELGKPYETGIAMLPISRKVEAWNREAVRLARPIKVAGGRITGNARLERASARVNAIGSALNDWVREETHRALRTNQIVFVLGGDHAVPFGAIAAYADRYPGLGILHIDAHCDLRNAYEGFVWSHASIFYNVMTRIRGVGKLVQVGVRDMSKSESLMVERSRGRITLFHDADLAAEMAAGRSWTSIAGKIVARLPKKVYVSFDIDGLDPTLCPHTGTPVPGGLSFHQAVSLILGIARSGRTIVGGDLSEVAPGPRGEEWDANVGARILYKMIGASLLSQPR